MSTHFSSEEYWQNAWQKHLETYLASPPRCGYWLASRFPDKRLTIIEIAGGSCRDSRYLAMNGYRAIGTDFDSRTIEYLKLRFPEFSLALQREDAFNFSFSNKSFDISFSNGFWVCFPSNQQLHALLREQERITSKWLITLVHNANNHSLVETFREKAKTDPLYDIRFFSQDELRTIINESGIRYKRLFLEKFGGPADRLYAARIKRLPNILRNVARYIVPRIYQFQSWNVTERIACLIELE
ncbi:MAG: methyltransferase domain-containing protein [Thermosphaera sp.]